jgi:diguanylate cyclase (GGDEF)-like protein/PAS domain S-box-containing protein
MHSPPGNTIGCEPLSRDQARLIVMASPMPAMVVDVVPPGFSVLSADPMFRRLVIGARHPAGPIPGEVIDIDGFGVVGPVLTAAVALPTEQQFLELPIGDEPSWFEIAVTPIADSSGACTQLLFVAADRTAAHDIEHHQRRSARRFQAMVTHAPGLILLVDSTGRIIRCSPAVDRLLGVKADELLGRAVFELMHPDTLVRAATIFNQILEHPGEPIKITDFRMSHTTGNALWCEATVTNLLHDDDVAAIVFNAYDVTDRRIAEQRLELAATTDALTGLSNRRRLEAGLAERFEDAARSDLAVGLALVDLDDFKLVNDALGHDIGDGVLRAVASRLEGIIDDRGMVARVGGDEFALLLDQIRQPDELARLAEAIHEALRAPVRIGDHDVYVRGSLGTSSGAHDSADAASLLRSADLALYRAKRNGRNQTVGFSAELQLEAEARLETITALQQAIREGRLRLAYQPVVDIEGNAVGAEALLRWEHDGELLNPSRFLELAEDTGLILPIGTWVLQQVCRDLGSLQGAGQTLDWVSVNLSSRQLLDERLPLVVSQTLRDHDIPAHMLAVEIDESTVVENPAAVDVLKRLDGVRVLLATNDLAGSNGISVDLGALMPAAVKLDKGFVQQLDVDQDGHHRAVAHAMVELTAQHGVEIIAEGVESDAQAAILAQLGCRLLQGFHFGEPIDLASFITRGRAD